MRVCFLHPGGFSLLGLALQSLPSILCSGSQVVHQEASGNGWGWLIYLYAL
jgi:hypothetical protein